MSDKKVATKKSNIGIHHILVKHALLQHKITLMTDNECSASKFRSLMNEVTLIMAVEATRDLTTGWATIRDSTAEGELLKGPKPVIVAVLRAGLGMSDALLELMPTARLGHIGLHRAEKGLIQYLVSLPDTEKDGEQRVCFVVDPVIGTGSVASRAIEIIKEQDVPESVIRYVTIIAAEEGLARLARKHPEVRVYYAGMAERLDENLQVVPHWGDASNRLFGIK